MEYKAIQLEVKDIGEDGRTVTGFAAVFGNIDSGYDRLFKGAFKKTLKENGKRVKHLWQHDMSAPPIAAVKELREVGREELPADVQKAYPDATGGLLVARKYLDTPRGNEILTGIESGAVTEMSFAYDPLKYDFEELKESDDVRPLVIRNLREVRLYETSDVVWGMNAATVASKTAEYRLTQLEAAAAEMDAEAKAGRVLSAANLQRLKDALDVLTRILMTAEPQEDDDAKASRLLALTEQINLRLAIAERQLL
jgi:HK97 family phage prohead protease